MSGEKYGRGVLSLAAVHLPSRSKRTRNGGIILSVMSARCRQLQPNRPRSVVFAVISLPFLIFGKSTLEMVGEQRVVGVRQRHK